MVVDFSQIPLRPPPPNVTSNFVDPPSLRGRIIAILVILAVLSTIFVALRLYTRLRLVHTFDIGDCMFNGFLYLYLCKLTLLLDLLIVGWV